MNAKQFAEIYAGQMIRSNDFIGRVVAWESGTYDEYIYLETNERTGSTYSPPASQIVVNPYSIKGNTYLMILRNLTPIKDIRDDCLDCGAIGDDPCKDGCRNKEL